MFTQLTQSRKIPSWELSSHRRFLQHVHSPLEEFNNLFKIDNMLIHYSVDASPEDGNFLSIHVQFSHDETTPSKLQEVVNAITENTELLIFDTKQTCPDLTKVKVVRVPMNGDAVVDMDMPRFFGINTPIFSHAGWDNLANATSVLDLHDFFL